ncbi:Ribulose-bisphosphate carboxylase (plasmid) [Sphingobium sp. EP60837]|nr:Ribulose-bisphosphate carboxylase [Sphingobium sp. EP60837]
MNLPDPTPALNYLGKRIQMAYVVRDMDAALEHWLDVMKVGPFVVFDRSRDGRTILYRGTQTYADISLAFAYIGDVQIEIIQPLDDEPSPFREFLDSGREGLHHIGFWPDDFELARGHFEEQGFKEIYAVLTDGRRSGAYYESPCVMGGIVELVPLTEQRAAYFGRMEKIARSWDGKTRPVRRFSGRAEFLASGEGVEV